MDGRPSEQGRLRQMLPRAQKGSHRFPTLLFLCYRRLFPDHGRVERGAFPTDGEGNIQAGPDGRVRCSARFTS